MSDVCRPKRRLFCLLLSLLVMARVSYTATPVMTTVADTVYRADGLPATGTLMISWPAFTTADGKPVAAGTTSVQLGAQGQLSVNLVPNAGANPAATYYTVVFQLSDGTVKTEYWMVPTTSPVSLASVRTTLGSGTATQLVSRQYVDSVMSTKAADTTVVHLSGAETIAGTKQFSAAPSVPTPMGATDAVNKAYVDAAVATVGSGSYVKKTGDAMTGPLTLSGAPSAPNQAATRAYVDSGLQAKADVVNGAVPTNELGSGTANGTTCLKGDSSWGACGSSSNAISIQGVPVDTTAPSDGQVITYEGASGKYKPKPGGNGLTSGMQAIKYATDFGWSQSPTTDLSTAGANTVSLASCPAGVLGTEPEYWVYIAGTGTAEAVKVTGGTCAGNGAAGTLSFSTANGHAAGYTIASASGGLQEAVIAARFTPTNPNGASQSGKVIAPPGEVKLYARVSFRAGNQTIDFTGSIFECWMNDSCLFVGDPTNSNLVADVTLINPRGRPMVANGTKPMIEVNAQKTRILNVLTRTAPSPNSFGSYVQVDDDQAFLLDGLDANAGYGVRCDATFCGSYVTAPGPFNTWSAVGWLKNLNISPQCGGNGIDWQSGNTLQVSDSVIQGYAQFGLRGGLARGGYGNIKLDNVYMEAGSCPNPTGNIGQAGVLIQGGPVSFSGGEGPQGMVPTFANSGANDYRYYIVGQSATYGASTPLYFGRALTNGTGNIALTWPDIPGATSFDVLRVSFPGSGSEVAPNGTGNYAVTTGLTRATACANGVCSYTDTQAALQAYTVATPVYMPKLIQWPGSLVLGASGDTNDILSPATAQLDTLISDIVALQGANGPAVTARYCPAVGLWSPLWATCEHAMPVNTNYQQGALILHNGKAPNVKGRLNLGVGQGIPSHIITLEDTNFAKTVATAGNRASSDVKDSYIGLDQGDGNPVNVGISMGAPVSISQYIANVGDGTNWKERLTANLKEFKTDLKIDGNLTVVGSCTGCGSGGGFSWPTTGPEGTSSAPTYAFQSHPDLGLYATASPVTFSITSAVRSSGTTTITVSGSLNYSAGQSVMVSGVTDTSFNGTFTIASTTSSTVTYAQALADASSSGGTVAIYTLGLGGHTARFNRLQSTSANPAQTGSIQLGPSDPIRARDTANSVDVTLLKKWTGSGESRRAQLGDTWGAAALGPIEAQGGFNSSVATGTQPYATTSTTLNTNLNADMVDGKHVGAFAGGLCLQSSADGTTIAEASAACGTGGGEQPTYTGNKTITGNLMVGGNTTIGGQLSVAGPYSVESSVPTTAMTAASAGDSKIGFDSDGKLKTSENGGPITEVAKRGGIDSTDIASANKQGNGTRFAMAAGAFTGGNYRSTDANGNTVDSGVTAGPYGSGSVIWMTAQHAGSASGGTVPMNATQAKMAGVVLTFPITTTQITYIVGTADNTANVYDIGIYDFNGNLKAHTGGTAGTTFAPATGAVTRPWTGGAVTLQPGNYYLALSSNCTASCAALNADSAGFTYFAAGNVAGAATAGVLNSSITAPGYNWSGGSFTITAGIR